MEVSNVLSFHADNVFHVFIVLCALFSFLSSYRIQITNAIGIPAYAIIVRKCIKCCDIFQ